MNAQNDGVHPYPVATPRVSDPATRSRIARIAAHSRWAHEPDRTAATQAMRDALEKKFLDEVDPDRVLDSAERAKRAASAKSAHYSRIAMKAAETRARRKAS